MITHIAAAKGLICGAWTAERAKAQC